MAEYILNERVWAENAIRSVGASCSFPALLRVAKYYYVCGYKKNDVSQKVSEYILRSSPDASLVKYQDAIDRCVSIAEHQQLIELDGIDVMRSEMDLIAGQPTMARRRVLFTLIVLARFMNEVNPKNNGWVNAEQKDIFAMANVTINMRRRGEMLHEMKEAGLIDFSRIVDNTNVRVLVLDDGGDPACTIDDFRNLGYQYMQLTGGNYLVCANCGLVVPRNSNRQMYCPSCAATVNVAKTSARRVGRNMGKRRTFDLEMPTLSE